MIKYIDNDKNKGIEYDFKLIRKEFKKLSIPADVFNPLTMPLESAKWFISLSDRSRGKTTNLLLLGMVFNKLYGTVIHYVRRSSESITPKKLQDLFKTIVEFGYIEKLTDGEYNNVKYFGKRWRYVKINEEGKIEAESTEHFMFCCGIDENLTLKSSYNAPKGDYVLLDEFIEKYCYENEFVDFNDLLKTIFRDRQSGLVFLSANTINRYHQYFHDLEIVHAIEKMSQGDSDIIRTDGGTVVYVAILAGNSEKNSKRDKVNSLYFGFKKKGMEAITGNATWAVFNYPHIFNSKEYYYIARNIYIHDDKLVRLDIVNTAELGVCIWAHWATHAPKDDAVIYSVNHEADRRYRYKIGREKKIDKLIQRLITDGKCYFSSNDVGSFVENYLEKAKRKGLF